MVPQNFAVLTKLARLLLEMLAKLGALVCVRVINSIPVSVVLVIARSQRRSDHKR